MEEEALVLTLFSSFSAVFREAGTPVDVNYVVEMMRNAVVSRGLTKKTCIRLVDAIQILSKFGVGFLTVEELKNQLRVGGEAQDAAAKVSTVSEVLQLATSLSKLSRKQAERAKQVMQANQAESAGLAQSPTTDTSNKESVLPERCTTPVWEEPDEPAARSFDSGTYEHPTPPSPPHSSSEHTITTSSLSTMTSLSDYSSASSNQDSGSELSSPTEEAPKQLSKMDVSPDKVTKLLKSNIKMKQIEDASKLTLEIDVPPHKVAKLLKSNMQQIEAISGTKLTLYRETTEKVLMVTGNQRQCAEARMMVLKIIRESDCQGGSLYRIPYGFFNQPKKLEAQLMEIGVANNCELRPVRDINNGLGFIFIHGSMHADVECCIEILQEWENTFLEQRTSGRGTRVIDANTPSPSATGVSRVKYSREELISLYSSTPVPKFTPFAENLGIVNIQPKSPRTPTTPTVFFQSPAKTKFWDEKLTRADVADKWEHDLFDPAF